MLQHRDSMPEKVVNSEENRVKMVLVPSLSSSSGYAKNPMLSNYVSN